ncbi:efflux RND transporter periplasmic adaptor subunit [Asticcacaulis machinosus]|uniref:Efflux RND transporter periplasmic adaptor subunit n=1 Tax=Asticcacaulis machinosus TaxID=2984211 RepID=A0ABT5HNL2_9CAUL|nr:efflux RND transporter periplasmic adaptor subunit [Asticcacaulis machinosus]MDC7677199.1 efflux RND transporter periplasmic adaptor subunit [Asticcacaulis machinosus]
MTTVNRRTLMGFVAACTLITVTACGKKTAPDDHDHEGGEHADDSAEFERGPQGGRLLRDGDFAVEVTIFEQGVEPEFRVYAYQKGKPVAPQSVTLTIELTRLGNIRNSFKFAPQSGYLRGDGVVAEPHSFDVKVVANHAGKAHTWAYASYEGRTTISAEAAQAGGVVTDVAGPVAIDERVDISGRVELTPEGKSEVRAWYPGRVMSITGRIGETVRKGQVLARVESSESLQTYPIPAPMSGILIEKNANVGDITGERPLLVIADPTKLHAEFFIYPRDAEKVRVGQAVEVRSLSGETRLHAEVEAILPSADMTTQTLLAHVHLPASASQTLRPGMGIEGAFSVNSVNVPLAVKTKALQRFRDFTVVFVKVENTYEVRMLTLGRQTPEWTEVLGGLEPGSTYVTDGAFLIRADIEKSGASHDH